MQEKITWGEPDVSGFESRCVQDGIGKFYDADFRKTKTAGTGRTDEFQCHTFPLVVFPVVPGLSSMCCAESEDSP